MITKFNALLTHYVELFKKENRYCSRKDFWIFCGLNLIVLFLLVILYIVFSNFGEGGINVDVFTLLCVVILLPLGILNIILQTKRFRDEGFSPWLALLNLVSALFPIVIIITIILLCMPTDYSRRNKWKNICDKLHK